MKIYKTQKEEEAKINELANEIGSSGDTNSREFARNILKIFDYEIPIDEAYRVWKFIKPLVKKYNPITFIPTRKRTPPRS